MKQKIVIEVCMNGQKSLCQALKSAVGFSGPDPRSKTLRIAVSLPGVEHAGLVGKDQIEVTGNEIDAAQLTELLRKRVGFAHLVTVTPVGADKKDDKKDDKKLEPVVWSHGPPHFQLLEIRDYHHDPCPCSIM